MDKQVRVAFEMKGVVLDVNRILPVRQIGDGIRHSLKYASIKASIEEVGVIEPLVVYPAGDGGKKGEYILLDGHIRLEILKTLGESKVFCLISKDDEAYTYNHKVNRLNPIQEHYMIMKAIEFGVSEEKIAKALNVDVARIKDKRNIIAGLCPEAVDLLKDRNISPAALALLKKVKPYRQIEIADLMIGVNNYTANYAKALVVATPATDLVEPAKTKPTDGISPEDLNRMRREMESLGKDFRLIEESYGSNMLDLTLARAYLTKMLENGKVVRFLSSRHSEILDEFGKIVESTSLAH